MSIIKLNAIDSTNDFLKDYSRNQLVENFTTVVTQKQTNGKGQMGAVWNSEEGKNLVMSILIKDLLRSVDEIFHLNVAITLSIIQVLKLYNIPNITVKWPNDILSENKKICGILIENSIISESKIESIVGIGLNINQLYFENLPKASSMALIVNKEFDLEIILNKVIFQIKKNCSYILSGQSSKLWEEYHNNLYKMKTPMTFQNVNQIRFMGIIQGVSQEGKLLVKLEDGSVKAFGIKEIQFLN